MEKDLRHANLQTNTSANNNALKEKRPDEKAIALSNSANNTDLKAATINRERYSEKQTLLFMKIEKRTIRSVSKNRHPTKMWMLLYPQTGRNSSYESSDKNAEDSKPTNLSNSVLQAKEVKQ